MPIASPNTTANPAMRHNSRQNDRDAGLRSSRVASRLPTRARAWAVWRFLAKGSFTSAHCAFT